MDTATRARHAEVRTATADVVVVGARCAGAATAMLLARAGHEVILLDRARFPSDTTSTHAIARSGVIQLHRWGLLGHVLASGAPAIRDVEFHVGGETTARVVKDRHGVDLLVAPRRPVLDGLLQEAAVRSGARLWSGVMVDDVVRGHRGRVVGVRGHDDGGPVEVRAAWVVGADGLASRTARAVGAPLEDARPPGGASQYAYFAGQWPAIEYHVGTAGFAGVFPTHDGEACVWVCVPETSARRARRRHPSAEAAFAALVRDTAPTLADRLLEAVRTSATQGMLRMPNQRRQPAGDGWALVGDAGYHRDAITGHGISDAFRDAELLSCALDHALREPSRAQAALTAYRVDRDRMAHDLFEVTCELGTFPAEARFTELLRELALAVDRQAAELAQRPLPAGVVRAA